MLVRADAGRLHQALGNLLSNAARHCRSGDTVTVTISATPFEALVEVADTGPGICSWPGRRRGWVGSARPIGT
ncbi:ATP-binding protein [Streptomyces sp. SLBN-8D4]|uniref:ATP-binding protein n=1 Tax=Streptomyces sp. SLBN-8D4 TaxID=3377728 RepID=UPI003C79CBEC